jgi:hypothetical protein
MGKSFDISNSKEYLEHLLLPSVEELHKAPTSSRLAIQAAICCWHLHDWVWAEHKAHLKTTLGFHSKDDFVVYLVTNCTAFEAIQGIANGSKHFRSQNKEPTSTTRQWAVRGLLTLWNYTSLDVEFKGNTVSFIDLLRDCVDYWRVLFKQHVP